MRFRKKLQVLNYARDIGSVRKTCETFGIRPDVINVNCARNTEFAIKVCNYITEIFDRKYIKAEIRMLQSVNDEIID